MREGERRERPTSTRLYNLKLYTLCDQDGSASHFLMYGPLLHAGFFLGNTTSTDEEWFYSHNKLLLQPHFLFGNMCTHTHFTQQRRPIDAGHVNLCGAAGLSR